MATFTSTSTGISQRTNVYAEARMLKYAAVIRVLDKFGLVRPIPKNKSSTITFRRPVPFTADTVPLVEGVTPQSSTFTYVDVTVSLRQYGRVVMVTDVIADTHEDPVLNDVTRQVGDNIGRTQEALLWGVLRAGTNVFFSNGAVRTAVNTTITLNKQRRITRALNAQKAMKITDVLDGSPMIKTQPIEAAYIGIAHTDLEADIRNLTGFTPVAQYGSRKPICPQEIGSVEDVRYILSADLPSFPDAGGAKLTMFSTTGTLADVYPVLYFGQEAYGIVPLRGMDAIEPTIIPVGTRTKDDPLGQRGYAGAKFYFAAVRLNEVWMARLEVAVTDL